jgi:RHS repeat-associated protein
VDSTGTRTYLRDGAYVTDPVLNDGSASYTPGTSERRSGTSTWYHAGFKNAESQTVSNQTVAATKTFDAFGNPDTSSGTWKGPFGYGGPFGYQSDPDSGLMQMGHRYYDSSTGRFLTRDKRKDERNWYAYTNGRPCSYADPEGQPAVLIVIAIAAVAVLAIDVADAPTGNEPPGHIDDARRELSLWKFAVLEELLTRRGGGSGGFSRGLPALGRKSSCFVAGTSIVMADGSTKAIERVKPGDFVLTRDENGNSNTPLKNGKVVRTFVHRISGTLLLKLEDGQIIETTDEHPFYVPDKGFVAAGKLTVRDRIAEDIDETTRILAIVRLSEPKTVYNFEVEGSHTYFVRAGNDDLWVHNKRITPHTDKIRKDWENEYGYEWPKDPQTGKPMIGHHKKPVSEGGGHEPGNILPVTPGVHKEIHKDDWAKWGALGGKRSRFQE